MKRAAATYSNRPRRNSNSTTKVNYSVPRWLPYGATALFAAVLCLTINFRAFTELNREVEQNEDLNSQIESVTTENLNLQEEIYFLQNDSSVIEREARKFGFKRQEKSKVPVPTDK